MLNEWLRAIRRREGLTQSQVAKRAYLTQPSYCNIENGKKLPSIDTAKRIAAVLDFRWTRFFEGGEQ